MKNFVIIMNFIRKVFILFFSNATVSGNDQVVIKYDVNARPVTRTLYLVVLSLTFLMVSPVNINAASDDFFFLRCQEKFNKDTRVVKDEKWKIGRPPKKYSVALSGINPAEINKWLDHINDNGSITLAVLTRSTDDAPFYGPDLIFIIIDNGEGTKITDVISVHSLVFLQTSSNGVNDFVVCKDGITSSAWKWDGTTYKIRR